VKSSHNDNDDNDAALKANKLLIELLAQSCQVPAQIRTLKSEADFHAIVNLMKKHHSCPWIQEQGCDAFQDHIIRKADNHRLSAVEGGIEAIVSAMATHIKESTVQKQGCAALATLAVQHDTNCASIAAKHGIEAVVSAMTEHSNVLNVQEEGCLALFNLSFDESVVARIKLEGGVAVLEQNPKNYNADFALGRIKKTLINFG
jgi:hypothetical protein